MSVPVLSWLFDARGRPPKEPFPVRPPAGTQQPALVARAARAVHRQPTGSGLGPPCPALRANPFPKLTDPFCRLPLPTLFHRPEVCSHSNPSQKNKVGRQCTPRGDPTNQFPCALWVYSSVDSHTCKTPWSVFQDGSNGEPTGQRLERADAEARRRRALPATIEETAFHERIESPGFGLPLIHAGPRPGSIGVPARRRSISDRGASPAPIRFPPDNFKHSLTLFSKSFSSFPRGKRSLGLIASGTTCVQRLDGSRDSVIHTKYRILQCSSTMREPRYPLPRVIFVYRKSTGPPDARHGRGTRGRLSIQVFLGAFRSGVRWSPAARAEACPPGTGGGARAECRSTPPARAPRLLNAFAGSFCCAGFDNDPSAGSPTETLLRLLLPLNDKVQWTYRDVMGSEPPTSPRSKHFTGSFNR
ncbi:hypothetical protein CQW23_34138 [Capsicum baccatum]|uniref:Protein TAR1 n=1 Tax=Capsicum baccatum TaxID=33114 RepID=A0A2G2V000_CAPBA|nr:hypothetical protein CQW23_34138 [Capsicum baccatum]